MTTAELSVIQDYARRELICALSVIEHAGGQATAGLIAEVHLEAIAIYLRGAIGAEAAYAVMTRHAETLVGPYAPPAKGRSA